jgi:hypothetical protein
MSYRRFPYAVDKILSMLAYVLPMIETLYFFGDRVFLYSGDLTLKLFYFKYLSGAILFYQSHIYIGFGVTLAVFQLCARNSIPMAKGRLGLSKFLRLNVLQAVLTQVLVTCSGQVFILSPGWVRFTILGTFISNAIMIGVSGLVLYAIFLISIGRYPLIPIITASARLQIMMRDFTEE